MMTIGSLAFSYHAGVERADRVAFIDEHIGWGQIIKEVYYYGCYHCITDTGVALVVDGNKQTIITLYLVDAMELQRTFNNNTPKYLLKKVKHYTKMGWVNHYSLRHSWEGGAKPGKIKKFFSENAWQVSKDVVLFNHGKGRPTWDKEETTMTKTMEHALDVVIRARGFEDIQTILFAHLLENGTIQEDKAMEIAQRVASLPFMEDEE